MTAHRPEGPLPRAVDHYRRALSAAGELTAFPIDPVDRVGVPVWSASVFPGDCGSPWSARRFSRDGEGCVLHAIGHGATDGEALRGALGELTERFGARQALRRLEAVHGSYRDLAAEHGEDAVLDPLETCPPPGGVHPRDRRLTWVRANRVRTGASVLVPIELVATRLADLPAGTETMFAPSNTGIGAGATVERALAHALLELVGRDGAGVGSRALDRGVVIDLGSRSSLEPDVVELLGRTEAAGVELTVKLVADAFGMAHLSVTGADRSAPPHPLMAAAHGEAVHPDRSRALRQALLAFLASRSTLAFTQTAPAAGVAVPRYRERISSVPAAAAVDDGVLEDLRLWLGLPPAELPALLAPLRARSDEITWESLPTAPAGVDVDRPAGLLEFVLDALADFDVLTVDLSPSDPEASAGGPSGTRVVRAVVPGLEADTPLSHRIGPRNARRLLAERPELAIVGVGRIPPGRPQAQRVWLAPTAERELGGPVWYDREAMDRVVAGLRPLYRLPPRHVVARTAPADREDVTDRTAVS